jgi:hypothetical protein
MAMLRATGGTIWFHLKINNTVHSTVTRRAAAAVEGQPAMQGVGAPTVMPPDAGQRNRVGCFTEFSSHDACYLLSLARTASNCPHNGALGYM